MMSNSLTISVIIPSYNCSMVIKPCLDALLSSSYQPCEIIVIDDGSSEKCGAMAREHDVTVLRMPKQSGPASGRNYGAREAKGDILFFVDSDIAVQKDTIARIAEDFINNPDIAAVFGSYDNSPHEKNFVSQFKNLLHHFIHQHSSEEAVTFWAGCGAIRSSVFNELGGFNSEQYGNPSVEDIELGYRMKAKGWSILLDKEIQVKHLKQWSLRSMISTDIFHRAVPWTYLMLEKSNIINDLNVKTSHRVSAASVGLLAGMIPFAFYEPRLLFIMLALLILIIILNWKLYSFFLKQKGVIFMLMAIPLHLTYYLYSGLTFVFCYLHLLFKKQDPTLSNRKA